MRLLLLPSSYLPVLGGVQTVAHNLAKQLLTLGHEVRVVTNRYPVRLPARETIEGVIVDRLLFLRPEMNQLNVGRFDLFAGGLYFGPSRHRRLKRIIRDFRPDVVNVHFPAYETESLLKLRQELNFRLIVSLHGHDVQQFVNGNGFLKTRASDADRLIKLLESADAVTAVSQDLMHKAFQLQPKIVDKSHVIPNGIDLDRFTKSVAHKHGRPYILAFGRLVYKKGFDLLIEAFAKTTFKKQTDLIIAGVGEELATLQAKAIELGLAENVYFFGRASADEVASLLKGSLGVVVPSRDEPFGIVALEALAAGKPLVATRTGGLQEWLIALLRDGKDTVSDAVVLVEPTVNGIVSGLSALLDGQHPQTQFRIPDKYTWPHIARRYEQVLLAR